jgi:septum formation protein
MDIILGSGSPRRKDLLLQMGIEFSVIIPDANESFNSDTPIYEVAPEIAKRKAESLIQNMKSDQILICCDTVVIHRGQILGKPNNREDAKNSLERLSGDTHEVMSAVCMYQHEECIEFNEITRIEFDTISKEDIEFYINKYKPFDKAGSYGIQEWIGLIGVKRMEGSYSNVIGLPTQKLFHALNKWGVRPY